MHCKLQLNIMKKIIILLSVIIQVAGSMSCKKEDPVQVRNDHRLNTPPKVYTGPDILLFLPVNQTYLEGRYEDAEGNVAMVNWEKISGPASYKLENKNALRTKLEQLEKGVYVFELSVTDRPGSSGKARIKVTVSEIPILPPDGIFRNCTWISPWYNSIEIEHFDKFMPPNARYLVYIKRDTSTSWTQVLPMTALGQPGLYEYFVPSPDATMYNPHSLYIVYYGMDISDSPDVKIEVL